MTFTKYSIIVNNLGDKNIAVCPDTTKCFLPQLNSSVPYLFCSNTLY